MFLFAAHLDLLLAAVAVPLLLVGGLVWITSRHTAFKPKHYLIYWIGWPITRIIWGAKVVGQFESPASGGTVVVCNHRGPVDPVFVALASRRSVRWMVANEYFAVPFFGGVLRHLEAIPTRRGGVDKTAIKETIRSAREGSAVGIFPEGKINVTDALLLPLRSGAAMVAIDARVPIVPCYIAGSPAYEANLAKVFFRRARTTITVGRPIDVAEFLDRPDERAAQDELTLRIGREIAKLAGRPDFEPELNSRRRREAGEPTE